MEEQTLSESVMDINPDEQIDEINIAISCTRDPKAGLKCRIKRVSAVVDEESDELLTDDETEDE